VLAARANVEVVDMESFALVDGLRRAGTRVAVRRGGTDGVDGGLPDFSRRIRRGREPQGRSLRARDADEAHAGACMAVHGVRALRALDHALALIAALP
jgi:hypothetical protein